METANIKFDRISKRDKWIWILTFKDGKTMKPPPDSNITDMSLNGKDVQVKRENGQIIKIKYQDKIIYDKSEKQQAKLKMNKNKKFYKSQSINKSKNSSKNTQDINFNYNVSENSKNNEKNTYTIKNIDKLNLKHLLDVKEPASAPYNFIPLNDTIVYSEMIPDFNKYYNDRFTGVINIKIETKTPIYIRGTLNKEQVINKEETSEFFSPADLKRIPGSSLRGMIRNLVEIVSFGKFGFIDDKNLYFRDVAGTTNLKEEYNNKNNNCKAGLLYKEGIKYKIYEQEFCSITESESKKKISSGKKYDYFNYYEVDEGIIVVSGKKPNHYYNWLIKPLENGSCEELSIEDIESYQNDLNRFKDNKEISETKYAYNLLESAKITKVPCFYLKWIDSQGKNRISFGHTKNFRIPYYYTIKNHIPEIHCNVNYKITKERLDWMRNSGVSSEYIDKLRELEQNIEIDQFEFEKNLEQIIKDKDNPENNGGKKLDKEDSDKIKKSIIKHSRLYDISEAIFGNEETFASRVFFEDAVIVKDTGTMKESYPKILSSPNPTSFQHYLVQENENNKNLNSYNSDAGIRGNKLYWHKSGNFWEKPWDNTFSEKNKENKKVYTKIKPLNKGAVFEGKIRFENLSKVELGALLFCLNLPKGCCHKIGMAKPLGLGSIEISPELKISARKMRYEKFNFEINDLNTDNEKINELIKSFEEYVLKRISNTDKDSLWNMQRLMELKIMLNFEFGTQLEEKNQSRYMEIKGIDNKNEFKYRPVLPAPIQLYRKKID